MGLKSFNPYTASRRFITVVDKSHITKQEPEKALLEPKKRSGGRNNHGEVVIWHRGGGHKKQYRKVDFLRGHTHFVATEIHLSILLLVAAAAVPDHHLAMIVAPARTLFGLEQRLFRLLFGDVALVYDGDEPPRRRIWIKALESHRCLLPAKSLSFSVLSPCVPVLPVLRVLDHLFAFGEFHVSLLPVATVAFVLSAPAHFPDTVRGADIVDFHLENLLHRFLDFRLRGRRRNFKDNGVLGFLHAQAFLGDDRAPDNLIVRGGHGLFLPLLGFRLRRFLGGQLFGCRLRRGLFLCGLRLRRNRAYIRHNHRLLLRIERMVQTRGGILRQQHQVMLQHC